MSEVSIFKYYKSYQETFENVENIALVKFMSFDTKRILFFQTEDAMKSYVTSNVAKEFKVTYYGAIDKALARQKSHFCNLPIWEG